MESIIYALFVWALFFIITFYGIRKSAVKDSGDYLVRLNSMRGIFAMDVAIGHVIRYENTLLYPLGKFMISVAFFFFYFGFWYGTLLAAIIIHLIFNVTKLKSRGI